MFYRLLSHCILKHDKFKIFRFKKDESIVDPVFTIDPNTREIVVVYNSTNKYSQLQGKYVDVISGQDLIINIQETFYELYPLLVINQTNYVMSKEFVEANYGQYTISPRHCKTTEYRLLDNKNLFLLINENDNTLSDDPLINEQKRAGLEQFIKNSGYIYPLNSLSFPLPNIGHLDLENYRYFYDIKDYRVFLADKDPIYLHPLHYLNQVLTKLEGLYPRIQFFSKVEDFSKIKEESRLTESNIQTITEYIKYDSTIGTYEGQDSGRRIFLPKFGSVVSRVPIRIDFEYITNDMGLYLQRLTDLFIDQFITFYAKDVINLPDGSMDGFPIIWDKTGVREEEVNKEGGALKNVLTSNYSIKFSCTLLTRMYRYWRDYPIVLNYVYNIDPNINGSQTGTLGPETVTGEGKKLEK